MSLSFAEADATSTDLFVIGPEALPAWRDSQSFEVRFWLDRIGFTGAIGQAALVPASDGELAVVGYGTARDRARGRFHLATAATSLPKGTYEIKGDLSVEELSEAALGWLLAGYRFSRCKPGGDGDGARLKAPRGVDAARLLTIAESEVLTRDLINTPPNLMGPGELETAACELADSFGASRYVTKGDDLRKGFPLIQAVGRASPRPPRLIDLRWGDTGPKVVLVGKGVCFDTGGLNLKPGSSMGLMKKDMGGAATVLGLARSIMALGLPVQLRVLIPAVDNSVAGNAFRPQDVLRSRKGLTVEINNTDAEGRLVLADALSLAAEENPDLLISMATLTGAARVALGPDIAPFFTDDAAMADALQHSGARVADPVWRLPFHDPYEAMVEPAIADLDNAPKGGMAGAITAALFLRRFAEGAASYTHFDIYGWQPSAAPARPVGGVGQGARAVLDALPRVLGL
ncbi:leucyl aminopeptidase family protein [Tropicimonas sediminicola]|uniref:Leucyl aminopeptidase n=1 Tax=Tropicimonas sediminicola TaxID=1031541 RepID=A0A239L595_9RHOB|nr:leucyl aminopeptidase family protein [Tropicimonas sediminicola]SNT25078.1 leucyl aminopeptidase [Tropicimonas sediminicola]